MARVTLGNRSYIKVEHYFHRVKGIRDIEPRARELGVSFACDARGAKIMELRELYRKSGRDMSESSKHFFVLNFRTT